ncbi:MAG: hypothetical protein A3I44_02170 [Candidatus Sungbacteria bacterium RIFCSPLOWO2_02_FULL_51_17]|uniref:Thymidylate kinase-like domain-containing protein n=1 Tax=Candidatus Sungbacteria bacterium RIFCSPHIGHO2_02_FULL_51_29 TaxID=1802273 RepID=A0A1G2KVD9_9BACT|nr:MAG: hypothetical protein A2676_04190 [Candidatus Sungbacteria bacterium RIFCSPHIGHO2_01_FULL_51_22]OHA03134.1 MAG: hypothetical protein A3C16_01655 [Candidatus Sungbacteria bacterium RIFCSPHIGHO2_02_FULL_51_29]OHA04907.1 MAG: hypothetical protein A3B29_01010 [Candidatus Sungbacteria bacterium RIFCSPLOWO2_01_FULL_51_34]OHA11083.1 MAG: hypothetical protein A3I44_02170 [Candidatus Sungbacteria bacterium RIFCSPLOWO2_02_FULL_51_17]
MYNKRGKFIVVEGVDGAGKTTAIQIALGHLKERLASSRKGFTNQSTWDCYIHAHSRSFLYYADFIMQTFQIIRPMLLRGEHVVQDRYIQSIDSFLPDARFLHNRIWRWMLNSLFLKPDAFVLFLAGVGEIVSRLEHAESTQPNAYHEFLTKHLECITERQQEYMKIYERLGGAKYLIDTTGKTSVECAHILENIICNTIQC